jgi:putative flippase GtrA
MKNSKKTVERPKGKERIKHVYRKNEEVVNYLFFGGLGFFVSIIFFEIPRRLGASIVASNIISWIVAVTFMYITNRKYVFKSKKTGRAELVKEIGGFFLARIFTLLLETGCILLIADVLKWNELFAKCVGQFVVIVTNYILSKFIIFKKKHEE